MPQSFEEVARAMTNRPGADVVFTNGAFRLFTFGHLSCLRDAWLQGDLLIIGVNSDASLNHLGRPAIQSEQQRAEVVEAVVHDWDEDWPGPFVILFDEPTPEKLIEAIRPDVLVKGGDYKDQDIPGAAFVRSYGGRVHFTRYVEGISTTKLLASG